MEETKDLKHPKNIRQIGHVDGTKHIYIEDYVMTYAGKVNGMAVLLGQVATDGTECCFYISGAVQVRDTVDGYPIVLSKEEWSVVYEDIRKYFTDYEILGWLMIQNDRVPEIDEELRKIHEENFPGVNKLLFLYDKGEKEEAFYISDNQFMLRKQNGYYIYFEKNESMQTYMVDQNGGEVAGHTIEEEDPMEKVRQIIAEKETPPAEKKTIRVMYAASTVLAAVVLIIGATMLDNYDKMRNMEKTLHVISDSMEQNQTALAEGEEGSNSSISVEKIGGNVNDVEDNATSKDANTDDGGTLNSADQSIGNSDSTNTDGKQNTKDTSEDSSDSGKSDMDLTDSKDNNDNTNYAGKKENKESGTTSSSDESKAEDGNDKKVASSGKGNAKEVISNTGKGTYVVQKGDTLASISLEFYHTYGYIEKIKVLNNIEDGDVIIEGQTLLLP